MKRLWMRLCLLGFACLFSLVACLPSLHNQTPKSKRYERVYTDAFDTLTTLLAYRENEADFEALSQAVERKLRSYHLLFTSFEPAGDLINLYRVNELAPHQEVQVPEALYNLIDFSIREGKRSQGGLNPALGTVLSLWHEARTKALENPVQATLPDVQALQEAAQHTKLDDVQLNPSKRSVRFLDPLLRLDLGSTSKGFAVERIVEELEAEGFDHFLLNAGGNVRAVNASGTPRTFTVGIENPVPSNGVPILATVSLSSGALVTSGVSQRYFEFNQQRYHHLIDPQTLFPASYYLSVSVYHPDSGLADALSTGLFTLPLEQSQELAAEHPEAKVLWVLPDGSLRFSSGSEQFFHLKSS